MFKCIQLFIRHTHAHTLCYFVKYSRCVVVGLLSDFDSTSLKLQDYVLAFGCAPLIVQVQILIPCRYK